MAVCQNLSGPAQATQRDKRPDNSFKEHRLTCTLFVAGEI